MEEFSVKFKKAHIENFCSYKELEFDFENLGLVNISGETGSGKSTILDIVPWILFGETSKGSKVDDIRSWSSTEPTLGTLQVENELDQIVTITRTRGSVSENDLYYEINGTRFRGRSIIETQDMLQQLFKIDSNLYFTSAYLHQFSKADTFFLSRPNERREVFERVIDQSFPVRIADVTSEAMKIIKKRMETVEGQMMSNSSKLQTVKEMSVSVEKSKTSWKSNQELKYNATLKNCTDFQIKDRELLRELHISLDDCVLKIKNYSSEIKIDYIKELLITLNFENKKSKEELNRLNSLNSSICPNCLGSCDNDNKKETMLSLMDSVESNSALILENLTLYTSLIADKENLDKIDMLTNQIKKIQENVNPYEAQLKKIVEEQNPFEDQLKELEIKIEETTEILTDLTIDRSKLTHELSNQKLLYSLSFDLRGAILSKALKHIENSTNGILDNYFDSEIKVLFSLESSDKLELEIEKNGNSCSFRQLSGGQRCMLKLAFNLSLMKLAENKAGLKFSTLMLDEPLTGLSDDLKLKAFSLFESLIKHYDTILVIEHSDTLKACFNNTIMVRLEGDESKISHR